MGTMKMRRTEATSHMWSPDVPETEPVGFLKITLGLPVPASDALRWHALYILCKLSVLTAASSFHAFRPSAWRDT